MNANVPSNIVGSVGSYSTARWLAPPPAIEKAVETPSGVGALLQRGHARDAVLQEVHVPPSSFDIFLLLGTGHCVDARIGDFCGRFGRDLTGVYFEANQASYWLCQPTLASVLHLHIPVSFREACVVESVKGAAVFGVKSASAIERLGETLRALIESRNRPSAMELESYAALIVCGWARAPSLPALPSRLAAWQMARVEEKLRADVGTDHSLRDMAAEARLSPYHFARCFKATAGEPPHRFLMRLRVEKARELLDSTELPVAEIAARVGYDDPAYLARVFRRSYGVSPARYRRESKR